jgi:hypothetical protein
MHSEQLLSLFEHEYQQRQRQLGQQQGASICVSTSATSGTLRLYLAGGDRGEAVARLLHMLCVESLRVTVTDYKHVLYLQAGAKHLKQLYIGAQSSVHQYSCTEHHWPGKYLSPQLARELASTFPQLEKLTIGGCFFDSDGDLEQVAHLLPWPTELYVCGCGEEVARGVHFVQESRHAALKAKVQVAGRGQVTLTFLDANGCYHYAW